VNEDGENIETCRTARDEEGEDIRRLEFCIKVKEDGGNRCTFRTARNEEGND
jgi:hypothetical protein